MKSNHQLQTDSLSAEMKAMLALMRLEDAVPILNKELAVNTNMDWGWFIKLVRHHRLSAAIYHRMKMIERSWIPEKVVQALHQDYHKGLFRMLHLSGELENIYKQLMGQQIRTLLLKGPALALELYGEISLRTSKDLDILIDIDDLDRVDQLLIGQGYEPMDELQTELNGWRWRLHHIAYFHPTKRVHVEVHWRLNPGPSKEPSFEQLWKRKKLSRLTSYPMYGLGDHDLFCYLVSHGARHAWFRLRWLADIDILARRQTDWQALSVFLRKEYHLTELCGQALHLVSMLWGTPLNNEMLSMANRSRSRRLAQYALIFMKEPIDLHNHPPASIIRHHKPYLFAIKSTRQKLVYLLDFIYPYPIDAQTVSLPKSIRFLYLPLRPILWIWRKAKHALT